MCRRNLVAASIALCVVGPSCSLVTEKGPAAPSAAPARPEPAEGPVVTSDVRARVRKILADPTMPDEDKLAALSEARRELLARRAPVLAALVREAEASRDPNQPEDPIFPTERTAVAGKEPLDAGAIRLLRSIHHARAKFLLAKGAHREALREVSAGIAGQGYVDLPLLACGGEELDCRDVRTQLLQKWPTLCRGDVTLTQCRVVDETQLTAPATLADLPVFARVVVTRGPTGAATTVTGADYRPADSRGCRRRPNTFLDANQRRLFIERTTWCKKLEYEKRAWKYVYELPPLPVALLAGAEIVVVLDKGEVQVTKAAVENVTVKVRYVVSVDGGRGDSFFYGEVMPAELARFPIDYALSSLHD